MDSAKLNDRMQIVGMAAIVASLIFVGLQMKQSQEIAVAAQYHQRAALTVESLNAELESGNLKFWGRQSATESTSEAELHDLGRDSIREIKLLFIMDNHHFQYQAGFMGEEAWQAIRGSLKNSLTNNDSLVTRVSGGNSVNFRQSFVDLCNEILIESDSR